MKVSERNVGGCRGKTLCGDGVLLDEMCQSSRRRYDGRTPLHLAASEGRLRVVTVLIEELHANSRPLDRWNRTPLDNAIDAKHTVPTAHVPPTDFSCRLSRCKTSTSTSHVSHTLTRTALHWQAIEEYLRAKGGAQVRRESSVNARINMAAALCDAASAGNLSVLRELVLSKSYPVDAGDYDARTALHLASSSPVF